MSLSNFICKAHVLVQTSQITQVSENAVFAKDLIAFTEIYVKIYLNCELVVILKWHQAHKRNFLRSDPVVSTQPGQKVGCCLFQVAGSSIATAAHRDPGSRSRPCFPLSRSFWLNIHADIYPPFMHFLFRSVLRCTQGNVSSHVLPLCELD